MRCLMAVLGLVAVIAAASIGCVGQDVPTNSSKSIVSLQSSAALRGGNAILDVTLSGSAIWMPGAEQQTGTVTMQARGASESRVAFSLGEKSRVEVQGLPGGAPACQWIGSDGVSHEIPLHNCLTDAAWFFPGLSAVADSTSAALHSSDLGDISKEGLSLRRVRTWRTTTRGTKAASAAFAKLSTVEYYLDPQSLLPLVAQFNVHPDDDAERDIPVEIRYADYRNVQGVQVPFRIQKVMNGALVLDITISNVKLNTGLNDALFAVQ